MPHIVVTPEAITLDGRPAVIQAGALHYFRLPHTDLWRPILERIRMGGLNAVLVPLPWAYHSPGPGFHDFTGPRDLARLFDDVERAGLWLIPSLGPWIGAGIEAGGVPAWVLELPEMPSLLEQGTLFAPTSPFIRHLSAWWDRAIALFSGRPNLIAVVVDPGVGTVPGDPAAATRSLLDVLRLKGILVPVAAPEADQVTWEAGLLRLRSFGAGDVAGALKQPHEERPQLSLLDISSPPTSPEMSASPGSKGTGAATLPLWMASALGTGTGLTAISPAHAGVDWGRGCPATGTIVAGAEVPVAEGAALPDAYYRMRRMALTLETVGAVLADAGPAHELSADPAGLLVGGRSGPAGAVAFVRGDDGSESFVELTLARGSTSISVGDIPAAGKSVAVLPMDWQLVDSRLRSTSMEPVLHTVVAGRELLILQNDAGGEVVLPPDFRVRHRRGPVYIERTPDGIVVHFDLTKLASVVLDGYQGPLQLLALDRSLAERTWPLDDLWRTTPAFPAAWSAGGDQPARGVVIGADFAMPEVGGGYRIQVSKKGFGYRWGPWRGSDPHTWLAPLSWAAPGSLAVPMFTWESRAGAPEVLPEYDARSWVEATPERGLAPEHYGIDYGFAWYRGYFTGAATSVRIVSRGGSDLYLNGTHIASLNAPREPVPPTAKVIPLPSRHLRAENVLAVLVEHQERAAGRGIAVEPHGLITCELEGSRFGRWLVKGGLTGEVRVQGFCGFADWDLVDGNGAPDVTWHRAVFDLFNPKDCEAPLFLFLDQTSGICLLYLNGQWVGRSRYPQGTQRRFWLPDGLLRRRGRNELLVAQWTRGGDPGIGTARLEAGAVWGWQTEGANP